LWESSTSWTSIYHSVFFRFFNIFSQLLVTFLLLVVFMIWVTMKFSHSFVFSIQEKLDNSTMKIYNLDESWKMKKILFNEFRFFLPFLFGNFTRCRWKWMRENWENWENRWRGESYKNWILICFSEKFEYFCSTFNAFVIF
jgi:hypothetical protein